MADGEGSGASGLDGDSGVGAVLYHGTTPEAAASLTMNGWQPGSGAMGANMGQPRYLYLSTGYEDALWFSQQKGCGTVVEVHAVPLSHLMVDPEDGCGDSLAGELGLPFGLPGKVALTHALPATHFRLPEPSPCAGPAW